VQVVVDNHGLIEFAQRLIQLPSPSGEEAAVGSLLATEMHRVGFDKVEVDAAGNVLGYVFGEDRSLALLLNGHIDHALPGSMPDPYSGRLADGARYGVRGQVVEGRGACDMKGAVTAMVYGAKAVLASRARLRRSFVVTGVVKEEVGLGEGTRFILEQGKVQAEMAVSGEATNLGVHLGHRGKLEFRIIVLGRTAHASNPKRGVNAIYKMTDFLNVLTDRYGMPSHPHLGQASFAVLDISASPGARTPVTPDRCELVLDRRYLPDESAQSVKRELEGVLTALSRKDPDFRAEIALLKDMPVMYTASDERVVELMQQARQAVLGERARPGAWLFGVDGTYLNRAGIPCVGFGPGDESYAHTPEDHVPVEHLTIAARVYAEMILRACA